MQMNRRRVCALVMSEVGVGAAFGERVRRAEVLKQA